MAATAIKRPRALSTTTDDVLLYVRRMYAVCTYHMHRDASRRLAPHPNRNASIQALCHRRAVPRLPQSAAHLSLSCPVLLFTLLTFPASCLCPSRLGPLPCLAGCHPPIPSLPSMETCHLRRLGAIPCQACPQISPGPHPSISRALPPCSPHELREMKSWVWGSASAALAVLIYHCSLSPGVYALSPLPSLTSCYTVRRLPHLSSSALGRPCTTPLCRSIDSDVQPHVRQSWLPSLPLQTLVPCQQPRPMVISRETRSALIFPPCRMQAILCLNRP